MRKRTAEGFPTLFVAARVGGDSVRRIRTGRKANEGESHDMHKKMFTGLMSVFTLMGAAQAALITIDGSTPNTETRATAVFELQGIHNWTADNEYLLKGTILVGNGAELHIEAGTVIRGANEVTTKAAYNVDYRPGSLIVERGGKIFANGTAENPIVMTDEWDNHFPWKNQWGSSVTRTWMYRNGSNVPTTHNNQTYDYGKIGNLHGAWGDWCCAQGVCELGRCGRCRSGHGNDQRRGC